MKIDLKACIEEKIKDSDKNIIDDIFLRKTKNSLASGIGVLDNMLNGFQEGELIVVSGRPKMGKTSFLLTLAFNFTLCKDVRVAFFSLAESYDKLVNRYIKMSNNNLTESLSYAKNSNLFLHASNDKNILIGCNTLYSIIDLKYECHMLWNEGELNAIFIDDFELLTLNNSMTETDKRELLFNIKKMSIDMGIPIIISIGTVREVEFRYREQKLMRISDVNYDEALDYYADTVCFIHRQNNKYLPLRSKIDLNDETDFIFVKNKKRSVGNVRLFFNRETLYFAECES